MFTSRLKKIILITVKMIVFGMLFDLNSEKFLFSYAQYGA